jgi:N-acyl homoserine lactone hydrolase
MIAVTRLTTGRVRRKRGERGVLRYLRDDWGDETLPVNVFLVRHPEGLCLFDAGQTARAARPGYFPRWYPFFRLARFELGAEEEAARQLTAAGVDPGGVRWVVLSHLHTDHAGGIGAFARAEVVVGRTEWERAQGVAGRLRGYLPQYWPATLKPRLVELLPQPVGPFARSLELTRDGALVLVATAGHTPGHLSLLVRSRDSMFLLVGDLAHDPRQLEETAPAIARWCRAHDVTVLAAHDDGASVEELYSDPEPGTAPAAGRQKGDS